MAGTQVQRLSRSQIDTRRWDAAVMADTTPLLYGMHWWLDAATDHSWEGLVVDDYRVVLALPRLRRFRLLPVYIRPPYTQQVGAFGRLVPGDYRALIAAIPNLPQIALPLRPDVPAEEVDQQYSCRHRINYVLDLHDDFEALQKGFSRRMRGYVRKHRADRLQTADRELVVELSQDRLGGRGGVRDYHFDRLDALIGACLERDAGHCYRLDGEDGEMLCAGFYPHAAGRTFNAAAASTDAGLKRRGMTRMLARILAERCGSPGASFDFEGSELPGVKEYFASFGGRDEGYHLIEKRWW